LNGKKPEILKDILEVTAELKPFTGSGFNVQG
jgi:hypothetical protein